MKNLFLIILIGVSSILASQNYHPIVYEYSGWNNVGWIMGSTLPVEADLYKCYFHEDTIINNESYHKYFYDLSNHDTGWKNFTLEDSNIYIGAMRNENKKYYFIPADSIEERLIYDFDLDLNDTIPLGFFPSHVAYAIITDTSHIILNDSSKRKKYRLTKYKSDGSYSGTAEYYESLGYYFSLVNPELFIIRDYGIGGFEMFSYCQYGVLLYNDDAVTAPELETCDFPVTIFENETNTGFIVKPNPISENRIKIQAITNKPEPIQYSVVLFNNYGQEVYRETDISIGNQDIIIHCVLPKGIFVICSLSQNS